MLAVEVASHTDRAVGGPDGLRCEWQEGKFVDVNDHLCYDIYAQTLSL